MTKDINKIVGKKIKALRKGLNLNQSELGKRAGLSRTRITQLELGNQSPTLNTLKLVADGLDIEVKDLFE